MRRYDIDRIGNDVILICMKPGVNVVFIAGVVG